MLISIFGCLFLSFGCLILLLPLIIVELSRPRDWLSGGLFLFLGVFLLLENDLLRGSINLFVVSTSILFWKMLLEITQNRWFQLSLEEKKRIGSFERWFESFKQLGQVFALLGNSFLNFFNRSKPKSEKPAKEKKWVHPELKEEIEKELITPSNSNKVRNQELTEKEETS